MDAASGDVGLTTVVFADVEGSTSLVDRVGDEAGTVAVGRQLRVLRERVDSYGGREVKSLGDGLMLTFASPRQAVGYALATQRALAGSAPLVRIGINTGEALDVRSDPIGGTVNAAARIGARAGGGEVLVADVVRQLVGAVPTIAFVDRGRHRLKGFADRWHLWQATDAATAAAGSGTVGRSREVAELQGLVASLTAGAGGSVFLDGEAGIGKSHLVREVSAMARFAGVPVVEVVADEVTRRVGLLPHQLADDPRIPAEHRDGLRSLLHRSLPGDPGDLSFAIVEACIDAIEALSRSEGALVVVEDAHWADDLSLAVVRSLIPRSRSARFGVVVSSRPVPRPTVVDRMIEVLHDAGGRHLRLGAFDEVDLHALAVAITGAAPGRELRARLHDTGGNPLFVTELLRSFDDEGLLRIDSGIAEVPASTTPSGLHETLVRRLSWLAPEARDLLRLASLLGTSFTLADLAVVTGRSVIDVASWLREAAEAGLITGDGDRLTFRHDLVRDAVYGHMLTAERRDLHRATGQALARAGAPTQQVARQFARGAEPGDLEAVAWLVRAADEAVSIAPGAALDLYEEALALASDGWTGRGAVQARMIEPMAWCGRFDRAEELATSVLDAAPSPEVEYAARRGLASVYGNRGDIPRAIDTIRRAVGLAGATPAEESVRLRGIGTQLEVLTGALGADDALRIGAEILDHGIEVGDATTQCLALQVLGCTNLVTGHGPEAHAQLRRSIALYDSGRVTPTSYLIPDHFHAAGLVEMGDLDGALLAAAAARTRYERRGALSQLPMAYAVAGFAHFAAGRFDEAIAELEASAAVVDDTGNLNFVLFAESVLARIAIRRGDLDAAKAGIEVGISRLTSGGAVFGADWLLDAQAQYLAATGEHEAALNVAELTWSQTESLRFFYGYRERGVVAIRLAIAGGRRDFAEEVAACLEHGSRRCPIASAEAFARQARGLVDGDADALVAAVDLFRDTPLAPAMASCCEDAADALAGTGRAEEAVAHLDRALVVHGATGATAEIDRVEATRSRVGAGTVRTARKVRPTFGWEALTPTELAVSELVAQGLTNPEIGVRLHVSRRTVESHLAHIFRKLDFATRTQLASEFTRRQAP